MRYAAMVRERGSATKPSDRRIIAFEAPKSVRGRARWLHDSYEDYRPG